MTPRLIVEAPPDEREAAAWATPAERALAATFSPGRRREYLAWRAVVRRSLGRETVIAYDAAGAPVLPGSPVRISVAHCPGRVAVCLSDAPCAVDVEPETRDFGRALPRYLTQDEQALSQDPLWPAAAWCAKEALYKFAERRGLELLRDLRLRRVDFAAGWIEGGIGEGAPCRLRIFRADGYIAVYLL